MSGDLSSKLSKANTEFKKDNLAKGVDFSKQFNVDKYNERKEDIKASGPSVFGPDAVACS